MAELGRKSKIAEYEGLRAVLVARQGSLSRRLAQVAHFCLNNLEQVAAMAPQDVALVLIFDDYAPEIVEIAAPAAGAGRCVLAITDNDLGPVVRHARHVLYLPEARPGHFRSQVPALVVRQALIASLGRRLGAEMKASDRNDVG